MSVFSITTKMIFQIVLLCLVACVWADEPNAAVTDVPTQVIIGGKNAYLGQFPHQVSLQTGWVRQSHYCGGSLIHSQWVLTAAHCIMGTPITVKAGKLNVKITETTEQTRTVEKTIKHQWYSGKVGPYDIGLLKLSQPFQLNNYVKTIALPVRNSQPVGNAILSGWGSISRTEQPNMPSILQTVTLPLMNSNTCKQSFGWVSTQMANLVHETNVCTGPSTGRLSACSGDSGGPLINFNAKGVKEVIGVVSWGTAPCAGRAPSVYVKVSSFVDWIRAQLAAY